MRRALIILFIVGLLVAPQIVSLAYGDVTFTSGIASGDVRSTRAILWTRVDQEAGLFAEVALRPDFWQIVQSLPVVATPETDFTVNVKVDNLQPDTRYYYRFVHVVVDGETVRQQVSRSGTFRTAPPPHVSRDVRFVYSGDSEAAFQPFEVLRAVRNEDADFFVYLGDTIYGDKDSGAGNVTGVEPDESLSVYRAKYRENRRDVFLQDLLAATSIYAIWDDHEVLNDFAGETVDAMLLANGLRAFHEYMPIRRVAVEPNRLFRSFRWGKDVELFILDERQYRSAEKFCFTETGELVLLPALQDPDCVTMELAAPDRTILGSLQKAWLEHRLLLSDATFKFIINEVPISQLFVLPYDRWEAYLAEREELLEFVRRSDIRNVIFLTTDLHLSLITDVIPSMGDHSVAKEIIVGPIGTNTLMDELEELGIPGQLFVSVLVGLVKPACVNLDTRSYAVVEVHGQASPKQVNVALKDQNGNPVLDLLTQRECRITIPAEEPARLSGVGQ